MELVEHVLGICGVGDGNGHTRDVTLASTLWQPGTRVNEGENRHGAMLSCMDSLLIKHQNTDKELVFRWTKVANDTKCNPPLPEKELRDMFDKQCIKFAEEKIFANREGVRDNSTNNNDNLISLDITESLQQEQILTRFVVDKTTSRITVSLNHAYEKKTIVSNISRNWSETRDIFVDIAKKKGVSDKHIDMLVDVLDDNNRKIMQCLNEQAKKDATRVDKDIVALDLVQEQIIIR